VGTTPIELYFMGEPQVFTSTRKKKTSRGVLQTSLARGALVLPGGGNGALGGVHRWAVKKKKGNRTPRTGETTQPIVSFSGRKTCMGT